MEEFLTSGLADLVPKLTGEDGPYPAGGAVTALVAALAASLAAAAADQSREQWDEAAGARAQAQALRRRAAALAEREEADYALARQALAQRSADPRPGPDQPHDDAWDWQLGAAVRQAAGPPLELAAIASDIAQLAAAIAERGGGDVQADAVVAAGLAAAAARAAAGLVRVNLVVGGDREPAQRAARYADEAAAAATWAAGSETEGRIGRLPPSSGRVR